MTQFGPFVLFDGNAREAFAFYSDCLGGELTLTELGDTPMKASFPAEMHHKLTYARLISGTIDMTGSDWLHPTRKPDPGNAVCLYLHDGTFEELKAYFDKLSDGANPDLLDALTQMPFGTYGALTDRFGVRWMFQGAAAS